MERCPVDNNTILLGKRPETTSKHARGWVPIAEFCPKCNNMLLVGKNKANQHVKRCPNCTYSEILVDIDKAKFVFSEKCERGVAGITEVREHPPDDKVVGEDERDGWDHLHAEH